MTGQSMGRGIVTNTAMGICSSSYATFAATTAAGATTVHLGIFDFMHFRKQDGARLDPP